MKRAIGFFLMAAALLTTGCAASVGYNRGYYQRGYYRGGYYGGYRYDRDWDRHHRRDRDRDEYRRY
ncbi:MAG TPA: hypothetical protein VGR73_09315 [Bryobacteraceae bacterium]|nr:hypothetical protein [Bryobacteraceae bacterium]